MNIYLYYTLGPRRGRQRVSRAKHHVTVLAYHCRFHYFIHTRRFRRFLSLWIRARNTFIPTSYLMPLTSFLIDKYYTNLHHHLHLIPLCLCEISTAYKKIITISTIVAVIGKRAWFKTSHMTWVLPVLLNGLEVHTKCARGPFHILYITSKSDVLSGI